MTKYVNVDTMLKRVCMDCGCIGDECMTCDIGPLLSSVAPEKDVVKVVRCKDCVWFTPYAKGCEHLGKDGTCNALLMVTLDVCEDDYCSYGSKKGGSNG